MECTTGLYLPPASQGVHNGELYLSCLPGVHNGENRASCLPGVCTTVRREPPTRGVKEEGLMLLMLLPWAGGGGGRVNVVIPAQEREDEE